ncbi:MAG: KamA family radical SAM protein [Myxococcota bacterium]
MSLPVVQADPTPNERTDWRWQARHSVRDLAALAEVLTLSDAERRGIARAMAQGFPMAVTPYYLNLCDPTDPTCPIRRQCIPVADEGLRVEGDLRDPLGEESHQVAPHLVRRYPDRALLLVTDRCGVYCRFCTRSRMVGGGGGARGLSELAPALAYLEANPDVSDVIVSGGDPGLLSDGRIAELLSRLAAIPTVNTVRFATRTPVTLPQRVTWSFCRALRCHPATWVMTHFNHPRELTTEATEACRLLADHGLPVMNQTVLLRGINDDPDTLRTLFRGLVRRRVRPYYLLQADPVGGTAHLRTPLARGLEIMEALTGFLSGIALPKFIVDTPGGKGKVVISPSAIVDEKDGVTKLRTFRGELVDYIDPPL